MTNSPENEIIGTLACDNSAQMTSPDPKQLSQMATLFKLLGDEGRLKLVMACLNEPKPVCCLSTAADMSQSLTSHHLRSLRKARILKGTRSGKQMLYQPDDHHIRDLLQRMIEHISEPEQCDD